MRGIVRPINAPSGAIEHGLQPESTLLAGMYLYEGEQEYLLYIQRSAKKLFSRLRDSQMGVGESCNLEK